MATDHLLGTVAMSVHNAIAVTDRPMSIEEVTDWLRRHWQEEALEFGEVAEAASELVKRGHAVEIDGEYDTVKRDVFGRRCMQATRDRDPNSPNFGWF